MTHTSAKKKKISLVKQNKPSMLLRKKVKRIRNPGLSVKYEHLWKTYLFIYLKFVRFNKKRQDMAAVPEWAMGLRKNSTAYRK